MGSAASWGTLPRGRQRASAHLELGLGLLQDVILSLIPCKHLWAPGGPDVSGSTDSPRGDQGGRQVHAVRGQGYYTHLILELGDHAFQVRDLSFHEM